MRFDRRFGFVRPLSVWSAQTPETADQTTLDEQWPNPL
jgi:hypothetical protein